jgi:hypothetical protein
MFATKICDTSIFMTFLKTTKKVKQGPKNLIKSYLNCIILFEWVKNQLFSETLHVYMQELWLI